MWNQITLVGETETVNSYGDQVKSQYERNVLAEEFSVGMSEFYQAAVPGYKPEIKLRLWNWLDYHGEEYVKYTPFGAEEIFGQDATPIVFKVIRTYRDGETLELTCQRGVDKHYADTESTNEDQLQKGENGSRVHLEP